MTISERPQSCVEFFKFVEIIFSFLDRQDAGQTEEDDEGKEFEFHGELLL